MPFRLGSLTGSCWASEACRLCFVLLSQLGRLWSQSALCTLHSALVTLPTLLLLVLSLLLHPPALSASCRLLQSSTFLPCSPTTFSSCHCHIIFVSVSNHPIVFVEINTTLEFHRSYPRIRSILDLLHQESSRSYTPDTHHEHQTCSIPLNIGLSISIIDCGPVHIICPCLRQSYCDVHPHHPLEHVITSTRKQMKEHLDR